ncbi:mesoderm development candidate 1-like isoform X2 [Zootermopsis nevadensis]|uniref:mesoderm development candidate 1-like isoform X2 n=1 Tax=Zootermopsis nevadensis TaxID=136037 RepID=UPI000B8E857C|nr:mesoderm development candidate 1-like isoform X2 [Zootermopsis nevadensis]
MEKNCHEQSLAANIEYSMGLPEARALALTCELCQHRMQTVADLLLLTSDTRPVRTASLSVFGESVARCRETVASRTRGLTVLLRDLAALIHRDTATGIQEIRVCIEEICDLVVSLTECCAHAGYLLAVLQDGSCPEIPGPVDRYQLCRAAAETEHKTGLLKTYRLRTVTALVFGEALTTACNALAVFATQDSSLTGTGAKLSQTGRDTLHAVLSACMGVVSPCVLVCAVVHDLATVISSGSYKGDGKEEKAVMRVQQCQAAVVRSASKLGQALGNGTDQR